MLILISSERETLELSIYDWLLCLGDRRSVILTQQRHMDTRILCEKL